MIDAVPNKSETRSDQSLANLVGRGPRAALAVFVLVEIGALALFAWAGRDQWFVQDEWDFLQHRELTLDGLMRPHYGHWVALPVVSYRVLYRLFGLSTYLPYQLVGIGAHLAVAALAWIIMRRAGVGPWLATVFAGVIALFGSGQENIVWAFQIAFTAGLGFGMVHLTVADRDGPIDRRDWLGLLAGLAAMMCSVVGVLMILPVGLATLLRRGWRVAAFHTVPLAGIIAIWAVIWGEHDDASATPRLGVWTSFMWKGISGSLEALGQWWGVAIALAVVTAVGLAVSARAAGYRDWVTRAAAPVSLFVGALCFLAFVGFQRAMLVGSWIPIAAPTYLPLPSRYIYMVTVMSVPLIAFVGQALIRQWRWVTPLVFLMPLVGLPGNIAHANDRAVDYRGNPDLILTIARVPAAQEVPPITPVQNWFTPGLTIGFLREGVKSGRVPPPETMDEAAVSAATFNLVFQQPFVVPKKADCLDVTPNESNQLVRGDVLTTGEALPVEIVLGDRTPHRGTLLPNAKYLIAADRVQLTPTAASTGTAATICR